MTVIEAKFSAPKKCAYLCFALLMTALGALFTGISVLMVVEQVWQSMIISLGISGYFYAWAYTLYSDAKSN